MSLTIFANEMRNIAAALTQNIPAMQREVAVNVVDFVANATPVDTGQASGNWKTTIGVPTSAWDQGGSSGPGKSMADVRNALRTLSIGQTVCIANNVPYIVKLNNGYSAQAPSLFVELATANALAQLGRYNLLIR